jgi:hypothetical protein
MWMRLTSERFTACINAKNARQRKKIIGKVKRNSVVSDPHERKRSLIDYVFDKRYHVAHSAPLCVLIETGARSTWAHSAAKTH